MLSNKKVVTRPIGRKKAIWMPETNRYILAQPPADEVARFIAEGRKAPDIVYLCVAYLGIPREQAVELEKKMRHESLGRAEGKTTFENEASLQFFDETLESALFSTKYYKLFGQVFEVRFDTAETEFIIHPQFAHLETHRHAAPDNHFRVKHRNGLYAFYVDRQCVGVWPQGQEHLVGGQFSMKMLEKAYCKGENQWMGVLHAAGVTDGRDSLIFAGDTGAGKSTLAALLMSSGFDVLADDFLPLEDETGRVCSFPAAISVKKDALRLLSPVFLGLKNAQTYHYPKVGKTVRYLPIDRNAAKTPRTVSCSTLVFVNYDPDSSSRIEKMAQEEVFARLIPDSWIQPSEKNARKFLEWFSRLDCYHLIYSNNGKMINIVRDLF